MFWTWIRPASHTRFIFTWLVVVSVVGMAETCWSADTEGTEEPENQTPREFKLSQIVVKDVAKETKRLSDPVPQTEVTREEIEIRNNRRLGDVIQRQPGVFMGGPPGENNDIRLRGLDKEFTRVQVDGIQLPGAGEKRELQVNRIPSFLVDSVRIIRNPTAEFESDGLAGRVDVRTRPIPKDPFTAGRIGYGGKSGLNGDLINGNVAFGSRFGNWFGIMASLDHIDQDLSKDKSKVFSPVTAGKSEREIEPKQQVSTNANVDLGFFYGPGEFHLKPTILNLTEDKTKTKITTDATKTADKDQEKEDEDEEKTQRTTGLGLDHRHLFPNQFLLETVGGYYKTEEDKDKDKQKFKEAASVFGIDKTELERESKEDRFWTLSTKLTAPINLGLRQVIKAGGVFRLRDRFRNKTLIEIAKNGTLKDATKPKDTYFLSEDYFAGFIQDQIFFTDQFSLLPGVRLEHVNLDSRSGDGTSQENSFTDTNPSLHALYQVLPTVSLRAAFSRSVNRPKFDEISPFEQEDGSKITIGNPALAPATSYNYDVGGEFVTPNFFFGINLFHKDVKDVIEEVDTGRDKNGKDVFQIMNVGDGWTRGIELEERVGLGFTEFPPVQGFSLWANQSFFDSELTDSTGVSRPFKQQPKFIANAGFDYTYVPWGTTVTLAWNYVGTQRDFKPDGTINSTQPTSRIDISFRQRLYENFFLLFEASNLTNARKEDIERKPNGTSSLKLEEVGQQFLFGLTWVPGQPSPVPVPVVNPLNPSP